MRFTRSPPRRLRIQPRRSIPSLAVRCICNLPPFSRPPTWRLFFAIGADDLDRARVAIADGAELDHVDQPRVLDPFASSVTAADISDPEFAWRGTTPLTFACRLGRLELVRLLLESGARLDVADRWHDRPLEAARRRGTSAVIALLESLGASDSGM